MCNRLTLPQKTNWRNKLVQAYSANLQFEHAKTDEPRASSPFFKFSDKLVPHSLIEAPHMTQLPKPELEAEKAPALNRISAWSVHLFTASGVIIALLAIDALIKNDARMVLLWLGAALIIDGLDGPLARKVNVTRYAPRFDGAILDLVIDYLTYAVIPALMVYHFGLVPPGWEIPAASFIMITSLYCFGNRDMKTDDNYFQGFPATWNLVVLFFFLLDTSLITNLVAITALGLLTFMPLKFVHPIRVVRWRVLTVAITVCWTTSTFWLIWATDMAHASLEAPLVYGLWYASSVYFLGLCIWRSGEDWIKR